MIRIPVLTVSLLAVLAFSLHAQEEEPGSELPFSARVKEFWTWWQENSERNLKSADLDGGQSIQAELDAQVKKLGPDFSWYFGPPPQGVEGHSFTLSPSGDRGLFFLTTYWMEQAPSTPGWFMYSFRIPNLQFAETTVPIDEETVLKAENIWFSLTPNPKTEIFDLKTWLDVEQDLSPDEKAYIVFLFLEDALGENIIARWIGDLSLVEKKPEKAFTLLELKKRMAEGLKTQEWTEAPYEVEQIEYTLKEPGEDFLRHDMEWLSTPYAALSFQYLENKGKAPNPIPGTGASFHFFRIPKEKIPKKGTEKKSFLELQDSLNRKLDNAKAGKAAGGGLGAKWAYFDVILFDEDAGEKIVQRFVSDLEQDEFELHSFHEKASSNSGDSQ